MKKIKLFLRNTAKKLLPNMSAEQLYFIEKIYSFYAKLSNLLKYGDYNFLTGISIETSTYCNRKCHYCPNCHYETPKLYADEKIIYKAIDDISKLNFSGWINFNFFNEPTLDERLITFIKYTHDKVPKATIMMHSNGDFLNIENTKKYKEAGLDQFIITIHDKNPEKLFAKLSEIQKEIGASFHIQTLNLENLSTRAGAIEVKTLKPFKYCDSTRNPVIDKDENMLICCNDYFRKSKMGNIMEKSILEIWNQTEYKSLRKKLRSDLANSVKNKTVPELCQKCYYSYK